MAKKPTTEVSIGKFDILATYVYAQALLHGLKDDEAKQRGMVAAIMGAQARLGIRKEHHEEFQAQKEAAEKKKKTTITAESFDNQVAHKMGEFIRCCRADCRSHLRASAESHLRRLTPCLFSENVRKTVFFFVSFLREVVRKTVFFFVSFPKSALNASTALTVSTP